LAPLVIKAVPDTVLFVVETLADAETLCPPDDLEVEAETPDVLALTFAPPTLTSSARAGVAINAITIGSSFMNDTPEI